MEAELFHADGRTDRESDIHDESNSRFRNFAKATNNKCTLLYST